MRNLPQPGTYVARRNGQMVVTESEEGALLLFIPYVLLNAEIQFTDRHMVVLGKKDGTVSDRNRKTLMKIFPAWDGIDPFGLEEVPLNEEGVPEFELQDCFHDDSYMPPDGTAPIIQFKAQWLNALGGSQNMPSQMDEDAKKATRTKWLGKFKALGGASSRSSAPATRQAPAAAAAPAQAPKPAPAAAAPPATPAKARSSGPPSRGKSGSPAVGGQARTATVEEVWDAYVKANPNLPQDQVAAQFYAAQDEVAQGVDVSAVTPSQWGEIASKLGV